MSGPTSPAPRPKLVFDLGGVVFRWRPDEFLPRLMPAHASTPEAARAFAADFFEGFGGDWGEFDRGRLEVATLAARIADRMGLDAAEARRLIDAIPDELQPLPGTVDLVGRLMPRGSRSTSSRICRCRTSSTSRPATTCSAASSAACSRRAWA